MCGSVASSPMRIMTAEDYAAIMARVSYKPEWEFAVFDDGMDTTLCITAVIGNSYRPGETVLLDIHSMIPPHTSESDFLRWLFWRILKIEQHEVQEWLKVDGEPPLDPHAERPCEAKLRRANEGDR